MRSAAVRLALIGLLACETTPAVAAPCAGFTDVADNDLFCTAVEWIRNRGVTLGCTSATVYCPNSSVTRASMALFLNRLGSALTPRLEFVETALGPVDPDLPAALCATPQIAMSAYPRQALVSVAFAGQSTGDVGYATSPLASTDNGASWSALTEPASDIRESVAGAAWTSSAASAAYAIPALQTVRFALGVNRQSGAADFAQARCQVIANVMNANGAASPFDPE